MLIAAEERRRARLRDRIDQIQRGRQATRVSVHAPRAEHETFAINHGHNRIRRFARARLSLSLTYYLLS